MAKWVSRGFGALVGATLGLAAVFAAKGWEDRAASLIALLDQHCSEPGKEPTGLMPVSGPAETYWFSEGSGFALQFDDDAFGSPRCSVSDLFDHLSDEERDKAIGDSIRLALQRIPGAEVVELSDDAFPVLLKVSRRTAREIAPHFTVTRFRSDGDDGDGFEGSTQFSFTWPASAADVRSRTHSTPHPFPLLHAPTQEMPHGGP